MKETQGIQELLKQLSDLGYLPYQIRDILMETVGTAKLENLSPDQEAELIAALEDYVSFALKCRRKNRK